MVDPITPGDDRLARVLQAHALLAEVSRSIGPANTLDDALREGLAAMRRLVEFRGGSIGLIEDGAVRIVHSDPSVSDDVAAARLPLGQGLAGRAAATGESMYSPDLDDDPRVVRSIRSLGSNRAMTSYLVVPLVTLGEVIGVLQVDSVERDAFDEIDQVLLAGLAAQLAGIIESARRHDAQVRVDRLRHDIVAMVSHELRTPLTIIRGIVGTVMARFDEIERAEAVPLLERADAAVLRLNGLIEELLLVSRMHDEGVRPTPTEVDLVELVEQVALTSRDVDQVRVDADGPSVVVTDGRLLVRALAPLVDNAIVHGGTRVLVSVSGATVVIRDFGPGIPADVRDTKDELFVRGSRVSPRVSGLGLGLPLARTLLDALGATLELVAPPDGGTECRVTVPDLSEVRAT